MSCVIYVSQNTPFKSRTHILIAYVPTTTILKKSATAKNTYIWDKISLMLIRILCKKNLIVFICSAILSYKYLCNLTIQTIILTIKPLKTKLTDVCNHPKPKTKFCF